MPKRVVALPRTVGMEFDIVSYGRRGPSGASPLSVEQIEQVKRTVSRVPEIMVKVSGGARDGGGAVAHLKYIGRHGKLEVETDDGLALQGRDVANNLVADWQLDLCRGQYKPKPAEGEKETRAKLVHNIVLSMPAGTPPEKVLLAARDFARENFALQYRYAMVLHTDQEHPHVHLVVKCEHEFEPGRRLYIRKVEALARAVRGVDASARGRGQRDAQAVARSSSHTEERSDSSTLARSRVASSEGRRGRFVAEHSQGVDIHAKKVRRHREPVANWRAGTGTREGDALFNAGAGHGRLANDSWVLAKAGARHLGAPG